MLKLVLLCALALPTGSAPSHGAPPLAAVEAGSLVDRANEILGDGRARELAPEAVADVPRLYENASPSLLVPIIEGVGARPGHESLRALVHVLGSATEAGPLVLVQIAECSKDTPLPVPVSILSELRPALRRASAGERLEDDSARVADEARHALRTISSERLGASRQSLTDWYESATRWRESELPGHVAALESGQSARVAQALLQVARFRVFRHELAVHAAGALGGADRETAALACSLLGHLGSKRALEPLIEALTHPSKGVVHAAHLALCRLAGTDLGTDPNARRVQGP